jgi:hypothetical protein
MSEVYNPLDKLNLARSIELELLKRPAIPLGSVDDIKGAGVYVLYYAGSFPAYRPIAAQDTKDMMAKPIYIGKAIPKGGRKGGFTNEASALGHALLERLKQHAASIQQVQNLDLGDFYVRYLLVDDIWIPLGENMLIQTFQPVWNRAIDGFGNKDPGRRRATQFNSPWDVLHPGREFTAKLAQSPVTAEFLMKRIEDYFAGRPMAKLPKAMEDQIEVEKTEAEDAADEA